MDRASDRIEQHIDREREVLRSNLEELEDRVRSVVDWRRHFRSNPALQPNTWAASFSFNNCMEFSFSVEQNPRFWKSSARKKRPLVISPLTTL